MRVGLLLPNSNFIPRLATDIRHALTHAMGTDGADHEFVIETTPYNESMTQVRDKLQDLLIKHDVDVVVAPLNPAMIAEAAPLATAQQTPLVVLTMGEDVFAGDTAPPWVFVDSMQVWRSAWLTGWWAATELGTRACTISAALEGGYGMNFAFAVGVEAGGGELVATLAAPVDADADGVAGLVASANESDPDVIMVAASGDTHALVVEAVRTAGCTVPLVSLPPHAHDVTASTDVVDRRSQPWFSSWDPGSAASRSFVADFVEATGRPAHAYALLAAEAGHLLAAAAQTASPPRGESLRDALTAVAYDGPRGNVSFGGAGQEVVPPQHLLRWTPGEHGATTTPEPFEMPATLDEHVALARTNLGKHGWLNPYLVA